MELHLQLGAGPQLHHQVTHKRRFEVPLNPWTWTVPLGAGGTECDALLCSSQRCGANEGGKVSWFHWKILGGGFKYFLFSPLPGGMIQFHEHIFQMCWFNHQLEFNSTYSWFGADTMVFVWPWKLMAIHGKSWQGWRIGGWEAPKSFANGKVVGNHHHLDHPCKTYSIWMFPKIVVPPNHPF